MKVRTSITRSVLYFILIASMGFNLKSSVSSDVAINKYLAPAHNFTENGDESSHPFVKNPHLIDAYLYANQEILFLIQLVLNKTERSNILSILEGLPFKDIEISDSGIFNSNDLDELLSRLEGTLKNLPIGILNLDSDTLNWDIVIESLRSKEHHQLLETILSELGKVFIKYTPRNGQNSDQEMPFLEFSKGFSSFLNKMSAIENVPSILSYWFESEEKSENWLQSYIESPQILSLADEILILHQKIIENSDSESLIKQYQDQMQHLILNSLNDIPQISTSSKDFALKKFLIVFIAKQILLDTDKVLQYVQEARDSAVLSADRKDAFRLIGIYEYFKDVWSLDSSVLNTNLVWDYYNKRNKYYLPDDLVRRTNVLSELNQKEPDLSPTVLKSPKSYAQYIHEKYLSFILKFIVQIVKDSGFISNKADSNNFSYMTISDRYQIQLNPGRLTRALGPAQGKALQLAEINRRLRKSLEEEFGEAGYSEQEFSFLQQALYIRIKGYPNGISASFLDYSAFPNNDLGFLVGSYDGVSQNQTLNTDQIQKTPIKSLLPNAFPWFEEDSYHYVMANMNRETQELESEDILHSLDLLNALPTGFIGSFNGFRAGMSIPRKHTHIFSKELHLYQLGEESADEVFQDELDSVSPKFSLLLSRSPEPTVHIHFHRSNQNDIFSKTVDPILNYFEKEEIPYNAAWRIDQKGDYHLYFIPRRQELSEFFGNAMASVEVAGLYIIDSPIKVVHSEELPSLESLSMRNGAAKLFAAYSESVLDANTTINREDALQMFSTFIENILDLSISDKDISVFDTVIQDKDSIQRVLKFLEDFTQLSEGSQAEVISYLKQFITILYDQKFDSKDIHRGLTLEQLNQAGLIDQKFIESVLKESHQKSGVSQKQAIKIFRDITNQPLEGLDTITPGSKLKQSA